MAARPHCVFDFVVPFHNSTKRAKLPGEFCTIEHLTGGIAAGDYDGDGLQDLYFTVFAKRSVLYKNLGKPCVSVYKYALAIFNNRKEF